jgi:hypothetical protein
MKNDSMIRETCLKNFRIILVEVFNRKTDDSLLVFQNNIITRKPTVNKNENLDTPVQKKNVLLPMFKSLHSILGVYCFISLLYKSVLHNVTGKMLWTRMQTSIYCQGG